MIPLEAAAGIGLTGIAFAGVVTSATRAIAAIISFEVIPSPGSVLKNDPSPARPLPAMLG